MVLVYYTWHKTRKFSAKLAGNRQSEPNTAPVVDPKYATVDYFGDGEHDADVIGRYEQRQIGADE